MYPLGSQLLGTDQQILLLTLPARLGDEANALVADEVRTRLPRVSGAGLVLDCSQLTQMNSLGITCLLQLDEDCRRRGAKMVLACAAPGVVQLLKQVRLDTRFTLADTSEQGIELVGG